jgi:hypothetical protein
VFAVVASVLWSFAGAFVWAETMFAEINAAFCKRLIRREMVKKASLTQLSVSGPESRNLTGLPEISQCGTMIEITHG